MLHVNKITAMFSELLEAFEVVARKKATCFKSTERSCSLNLNLARFVSSWRFEKFNEAKNIPLCQGEL